MSAALLTHFDDLDLGRQRELVRGLLEVTVHPGRAPERVVVEHKVAASLSGEEVV